jgi:diadenosine tetraphosphatase ApaH/serine/threonine PP2A family protein phosphatase
MRYLILSDIHSNLAALNACIDDAEDKEIDKIICLGDIVGYAAKPNQCIEILRKKNAICILGNHDAACINKIELNWFNSLARFCIEWTIKELKKENKEFLLKLPEKFCTQEFFAVHGSPFSPLKEYMDEEIAFLSFQEISQNILLCGHSHIPFIIEQGKGLLPIKGDKVISLKNSRFVISVPSVGQPRDFDSRAGYAILDLEKMLIEIYRVKYDIEQTIEEILSASLPKIFAERLRFGR